MPSAGGATEVKQMLEPSAADAAASGTKSCCLHARVAGAADSNFSAADVDRWKIGNAP